MPSELREFFADTGEVSDERGMANKKAPTSTGPNTIYNFYMAKGCNATIHIGGG